MPSKPATTAPATHTHARHHSAYHRSTSLLSLHRAVLYHVKTDPLVLFLNLFTRITNAQTITIHHLLLVGCNKAATDKQLRVMNAAARVVSGTTKYDRGLRQLRHAELHWLDVADRVTFKLCMTV